MGARQPTRTGVPVAQLGSGPPSRGQLWLGHADAAGTAAVLAVRPPQPPLAGGESAAPPTAPSSGHLPDGLSLGLIRRPRSSRLPSSVAVTCSPRGLGLTEIRSPHRRESLALGRTLTLEPVCAVSEGSLDPRLGGCEDLDGAPPGKSVRARTRETPWREASGDPFSRGALWPPSSHTPPSRGQREKPRPGWQVPGAPRPPSGAAGPSGKCCPREERLSRWPVSHGAPEVPLGLDPTSRTAPGGVPEVGRGPAGG